jgi:hypothetical protein
VRSPNRFVEVKPRPRCDRVQSRILHIRAYLSWSKRRDDIAVLSACDQCDYPNSNVLCHNISQRRLILRMRAASRARISAAASVAASKLMSPRLGNPPLRSTGTRESSVPGMRGATSSLMA